MNKNKIYSLLVMILLVGVGGVNGQLNVKVGYNGGWTKAPVLNKVVDDFNANYSTLEDKLDRMTSMHGVEIGLRYRMSSVGFEVSWSSITDRSDVYGTIPSYGTFSDKWFMSMTDYSIGIENYIGRFGYGASLAWRTARLKTDIVGAKSKKRVVTNESALSNKFYLLYQVGGSNVSLALKPYVQFPIKNLDVSDFDRELNIQIDPSYIAPSPLDERFFIYGISVVLYNGRQN